MSENIATRRINAEFIGDAALEVDLLERALRIDDEFKTKSARDNAIASIAVTALSAAVKDCSAKTGKRFPSYQDVLAFLGSVTTGTGQNFQ